MSPAWITLKANNKPLNCPAKSGRAEMKSHDLPPPTQARPQNPKNGSQSQTHQLPRISHQITIPPETTLREEMTAARAGTVVATGAEIVVVADVAAVSADVVAAVTAHR